MTTDATPGALGSNDHLGPEASGDRARAFAQSLRGIADGFDQRRAWFRPASMVMSTLRRAADELERSADALAAERERCALRLETMAARIPDGDTDRDALLAAADELRKA